MRPPLSDELNMHERRRLRVHGRKYFNDIEELENKKLMKIKDKIKREKKSRIQKYKEFIKNGEKELINDFKYLLELRDMFNITYIDNSPIANFIWYQMYKLDNYNYELKKKLQIIYKYELIPCIVTKIESIHKHVFETKAWKNYSYFDQYIDIIINNVCDHPEVYIGKLSTIVYILKQSFGKLTIDDLNIEDEILDELSDFFNNEHKLLYDQNNIIYMRVENLLYNLEELINENKKITILPNKRQILREKLDTLNNVKNYILNRISDTDIHILYNRLEKLNN